MGRLEGAYILVWPSLICRPASWQVTHQGMKPRGLVIVVIQEGGGRLMGAAER